MVRRRLFWALLVPILAVLVAACSSSGQPSPTAAPASSGGAAPTEETKTFGFSTPLNEELHKDSGSTEPTSQAKEPTSQAKAPESQATDWPTKPITMIIPYPAGGSTDVGGRIVAALLEKELGQPVQVLNKGGAGGQVGWTDLHQAPADGYTFGAINLPHIHSIIVEPDLQATFKADDFIPLVSQALDPTMIAVAADNEKYQTLEDLIKDAKSRPGEITGGIVGILQDDEIGYLQTAEAAGIELRLVRFDGAAPTITALLGGHVDVTFNTVADNYAQFKAGKIRPLAVLNKERVTKFYPDVPTAAELGYEAYSASTRGYAAPKGVPEPILKKLEAALLKVMNSPEHIEKIESTGAPVKIMNREEFTKYYQDQYDLAKKWQGKGSAG